MKNLVSKLACGLVLTVVAGSSLVGCGDDSNGGGGISSGVDTTKKGEDVTDAEAAQICKAANDYFATKMPTKAQFCQLVGVASAKSMASSDEEATDAELQTACTSGVKLCNDSDEPLTPETDDCEGETAPETCSSTVGEIEACLGAFIDQQVAIWNSAPSCDSLTRASIEADESTDESAEYPAACDTVAENCPEALN